MFTEEGAVSPDWNFLVYKLGVVGIIFCILLIFIGSQVSGVLGRERKETF